MSHTTDTSFIHRDLTVGRTHLSDRHMAAIVHANIRQILVDAMSDHIGHALVVAGGAFHFRTLIAKELGGYFNGNRMHVDSLADAMFRFLERQWPQVMFRHYGNRTITAKAFLDAVNEISPPSEREIEEGWELEIAGDERAMRQLYDGSARVRKGSDLGVKRVRG